MSNIPDWIEYDPLNKIITIKGQRFAEELFDKPIETEHPAIRIYDFVWKQTPEHEEECIYACSYTPAIPLKNGQLLAVVDPKEIPGGYLQRECENVITYLSEFVDTT